ncbi:hypothetical protein KC333_g86 [Hortaea werneckii]|nr:hypothetical protein KC333_g86 [Hortaea werneckii]
MKSVRLQLWSQYDDILRARFLFRMSYNPSSRVNGQEGTAGQPQRVRIGRHKHAVAVTLGGLESHLVYMHMHLVLKTHL